MDSPFEYKGIRWKKYHKALIPLAPADTEIYLKKEEEQELLKRSDTFFIRYTTDFDDPSFHHFWYVIKDGTASMDELSSNTRNQVRKGLKNCEVSLVDKKEIMEKGHEVYRKAFARYDTKIAPFSEESFKANLDQLEETEWDFWKVSLRSSGETIAYSRNRNYGHCCDYTEIKFDPAHLKKYPSYALFQTMNEHYLNEKGYQFVNDGARSISHETNIQDFLIRKFKFRKAYCKLHVIHKPWLGLLVRAAYPFKGLIRRLPGSRAKQLNTLLTQESIVRNQEGG
ncbi:MAG: hypothetical protein ABEH38_06190 [Flavobacteriales bacterium]